MRLLITGGYGFIASHFINYFFEKYPESKIINIDAMYYCAIRENVKEEIRNDVSRYAEIVHDLSDTFMIQAILEIYNVDHVIHFAAQTHVQNSFDTPLEYMQDNVVATHNLLDACRRWGRIEKFVHVSTDEVYGEARSPKGDDAVARSPKGDEATVVRKSSKNETRPKEETFERMDENTALRPTNPYAATKAAAEMIVQSYIRSFRMPIVVTRGNNVFGPGQYGEKLIPRFISLLRDNKPVTIQGTGRCLRSFLYIDDVIHAFDTILLKGVIGEVYNIGGDDNHERSVLEVAQTLIKKIKGDNVDVNQWIEYIPDRMYNDVRYYITNEKLKELGWSIKNTFEKGMDKLLSAE